MYGFFVRSRRGGQRANAKSNKMYINYIFKHDVFVMSAVEYLRCAGAAWLC